MTTLKVAAASRAQRSILGKNWKEEPYNLELVNSVSRSLDLPEIIIRIISHRVKEPSRIDDYLQPKIKNLMPDPFHLQDMSTAVTRVIEAINAGEKIVIFGDYDVDGATSTALLKRYFDHLNIEALCYIPDRITEGYGPSINAFNKFKEQGYNLVITLDCGTMAFDAINHAGKIGLDVIIIDHHQSTENLPSALAIINPNRFDETSNCKTLAACGVSFLFLAALSKKLKINTPNKSLPDLINYLDLVALGTVCDIMKLTDLNRAFVKQGLKILQNTNNPGLKALIEASGADARASTYLLGFLLGPRINAGGRVGKSYLGAKLLSTNDASEADAIAAELSLFNDQRKQIEFSVLEEATEIAKQSPSKVLIIAGENWHQGVIGIVASRIKERYNKPTIIISLDNEKGKASSRSIAGFDLGAAIIKAKCKDIIIEGGGHAMAAGFTIEKTKIPLLHEYLNAEYINHIAAIEEQNVNHYSATLLTSAINEELCDALEMLEPFGPGNEEPRFLIKNCYLSRLNRFGNNGLSFSIDNANGSYIRAKIFGSTENLLIEEIFSRVKSQFHFVGRIKKNNFYLTRKTEMIIEDILYD